MIIMRKQKMSGNLKKRRDAVESRFSNWYPNLEILVHYVGTHSKMKFRCKRCGYVFNRKPANFMYDSNRTKYGCPKCDVASRINDRTLSLKDALQRIHKRFPNVKYVGGYRNNHEPAVFKCLDCGKTFKRAPIVFETSRSGCPYCVRKVWGHYRRMDPKEYERRFNEKFPNLILLTRYVNSRTPIKVKCNRCGHVWSTSPSSLLNKKYGCRVCYFHHRGLSDRKSQQQFWADLKKVNPSILPMGKYEGNKIPIKVKCRICGNIWMSRPNDLLTRHGGCIKCANAERGYRKSGYCKIYRRVRSKRDDESFQHYDRSAYVYCFKKKHPNVRMLTLFNGTDNLIKIKCLTCGHVYVANAWNLLFGPACVRCESIKGFASKGEKLIADLLDQAGIYYQYPFIPSDLIDKSPLHFDFRVNGRYLIEFQGEQHYRPISIYGGSSSFVVQQKHDMMKKEWAKNHHFVLIEIRFDESVKQKLGQYFPKVLNYEPRIDFKVKHYRNRYHSAVRLNSLLVKEVRSLIKDGQTFSRFMNDVILYVGKQSLKLDCPKYVRAKSRNDVVVKTVLLTDEAYKIFSLYRQCFESDSAELRAFLHTCYSDYDTDNLD